ncbi:MAG: hypothetical protein U0W40_08920 [Acidimicrobiia bacterium]
MADGGRISYLEAPEGWTRGDARGPAPFVTRETFTRPDGTVVTWSSRSHRKQAGPYDAGRGSTWWAPTALGWWIGVLFAIGAACFTIGPFPGYADAVGERADAITFFVGSIFFTSAAFLQYVQAVNAPRDLVMPLRRQKLTIWAWEPGRIDWESTAVQFVGTVFFNVTTFAAIDAALSTQQATRLVWVPDAAGSVCFLVASWLAWTEVAHGAWSWSPRDLGWWVAGLNMLGSIAFGVSAVAAFYVPTTGDMLNTTLVNLGTAIGGACFFAGALLLLPERTRPTASSTSAQGD